MARCSSFPAESNWNGFPNDMHPVAAKARHGMASWNRKEGKRWKSAGKRSGARVDLLVAFHFSRFLLSRHALPACLDGEYCT